jgi:hypothetical protein
LALILLSLTGSCRQAASIPNSVSDDEYALYAAWINHHFKEQPQRLLLQSVTFQFDPLAENGCLQHRNGKLDRTALEMLGQYRPLGSAIYPVQTGRLQRSESRVKWRYEELRFFTREDPTGVYSLVSFSRAVFNESHTRAFVAVSDACGGLCGRGWLVTAHRQNGQWIFDPDGLCVWLY